MNRGRGTVTVTLEDGSEHSYQGQVTSRESLTNANVESSDGSRKSYPVHTASIDVVIRDISWEVFKGKSKP